MDVRSESGLGGLLAPQISFFATFTLGFFLIRFPGPAFCLFLTCLLPPLSQPCATISLQAFVCFLFLSPSAALIPELVASSCVSLIGDTRFIQRINFGIIRNRAEEPEQSNLIIEHETDNSV